MCSWWSFSWATPLARLGLVPRYAAFLRAINIGGRRITSAELRMRVEAIGFQDVSVFRASGNVVLDAGSGSAAKVTARIEEGLTDSLGYEVVAFVRSAGEVRAMADYDPFPPSDVQASAGKLQVALLLKPPSKRARTATLAMKTNEDRLAFGPRELYWLPAGGTMESALDRKALVAQLGAMTFRTKGTVEQIARKYFGA